jgi:hypothetical protein
MKSAAALVVLLAACGGDDAPATIDAASADSPMADAGFGSTCQGTCTTTVLTAAFMVTRTLDAAYFGITAADNTLHVEAYRGAAAGCPTTSSPTPEYTLVLGRVTRPTSTQASTSPGNILDYQGDLLGGPLGQAASTVTITPVAASGDSFVALDLMLVFPSGTVMGHLYATHCTSLDS